MNKALLFLPFLGAFLGYILARAFEVENSLAILGIAIAGMLAAGISGIILTQRSRR